MDLHSALLILFLCSLWIYPAGAFLNRFAIGFLIPNTTLPFRSWINGLLIGFLLSLPDAIITNEFAPILGFGAIGGVIIGFIVGKKTQ